MKHKLTFVFEDNLAKYEFPVAGVMTKPAMEAHLRHAMVKAMVKAANAVADPERGDPGMNYFRYWEN